MATKLVYIVDDDAAIRESTDFLLRIAGYEAQSFPSGAAFLSQIGALARGCVLLDINMPELSGLQVQEALREREIGWPTIIITAEGDIPVAVQAMKNGAFEFLEKPYESRALLDALECAFQSLEAATDEREGSEDVRQKISTLTRRETEVFQLMIAGLPNKMIAHELEISPRTVEIYRANVMEKLEVRSLAAAVRLGLSAGLAPPNP